jgi:hypothetical protein
LEIYEITFTKQTRRQKVQVLSYKNYDNKGKDGVKYLTAKLSGLLEFDGVA